MSTGTKSGCPARTAQKMAAQMIAARAVQFFLASFQFQPLHLLTCWVFRFYLFKATLAAEPQQVSSFSSILSHGFRTV
ncbi:MAG: hypothetical protein ACLFVC_09395 [Opitutales bacterium]